MKNIIFFSFLFLIANMKGYSSDYILKINFNVKAVECKINSINNGIVSFSLKNDKSTSSYSLNDIYGFSFINNNETELYIPFYQLDTIVCKVDSILGNKVYYHTKDNFNNIIDKRDLFCIQFNELKNNNELQQYKNELINKFCKVNAPISTLTMTSGVVYNNINILSMNNDTLEIILLSGNKEIKTYASTKAVSNYIQREPFIDNEKIFRQINNGATYLIEKNELKEIDVTKTTGDKIEFRTIFNGTVISTFKLKNEISGLFFSNYNENNNGKHNKSYFSPDINENYSSSGNNSIFRFRINFSAGFGHLLNSVDKYVYEHSSDQEKEYYDDLMNGYTIDANINFIFLDYFGIGFKYNQFKTSNSFYDFGSDDMTTKLMGVSLLLNYPLPEKLGYVYAYGTGGSLSLINNATIRKQNVKIEGSTFGYYFGFGTDFYLYQNLAIGLNAGLTKGSIKKYKFNNEEVTLSEPDDMGRIECTAGLVLIF